jgi:hypothetical protein
MKNNMTSINLGDGKCAECRRVSVSIDELTEKIKVNVREPLK